MLDHLWRSLVEDFLRNSLKYRKAAAEEPAQKSGRTGSQAPRLELPWRIACLLATAVAIVTNPISHTLVAGQTATFSAAATGNPTPTVQWEMSPAGSNTFTPLSNVSPFSGVTTDTLTVAGASRRPLSGDQFEAVFTANPSPTVASTPATLTVIPALAISPLTQTGWTKNYAGFSGAMPISGGIGPFTIVSDSGLPTGLTAVISGNAIRFTGTPTAAQVFASGGITIEDSVGDKASRSFSITINAAPTISHMSNNNWTQGLATFTGAMTISGGTGPFTIVSQSNLPPNTTAVIHGNSIAFTGTPSVAQNFGNCTVTIEDAAGAFAGKTFVIDVDPAIILGNITLNQWTVGQPGFPSTIKIGGGTGPFALAGSSGLPTGLSADVNGRTIAFTGTPTAVGTFAKGSVTVEDADGAMLTDTFSITINQAPTLSTLSQLAWTGGNGGFTGTITISGGTAPYVISGYGGLPFTPSVSGNTVYFTGAPPSQTLTDGSLSVTDKTGAAVTETIPTFRVNIIPTANALTTNQWTVGQPGFNGIMTINNGTAPFKVLDFHGLPTGLTPIVSGAAISFVGTPTGAQTFGQRCCHPARQRRRDHVSFNVSITINPALTITTTSLPALQDGVAYSAKLKSTGGTGANVFSVTAGSLPPGLTLATTGSISGVSTATKSYTFTVTDTDAAGAQSSETFTIAAAPAFAIGNLTQPQWTIGESNFPGKMTITGGTGTFSITSVTGLPTGLTATLNGATIAFTGIPTSPGIYAKGSITVADSGGISVTTPFTITINSAPALGSLSETTWTAGAPGFTGAIAITRGTGPYTIVNVKGLPFTPVVSGNTIVFTGSADQGVYANGSFMVVDAAGAGAITKVTTITINAPMTISHMSVNNWTAGAAELSRLHDHAPAAPGRSPSLRPKTCRPAWTPVISGDTIRFTGTPAAAGTFNDCTVTISRCGGACSASRHFVHRTCSAADDYQFSSARLGPSGVPYSATLNTITGAEWAPGHFCRDERRSATSGLTLHANWHDQRHRHGRRIVYVHRHRHRRAWRQVQRNVHAF